MQPDTGQRLRTHTRDCVQSHSDSAGFMLLALLINACASKRYDRFQIRFLIMIMCGRKSLLNNVDSFHLYAVEDRKTRCETFLCAFLIQQRTWNVIRNAFPKCFFFANDLLYCPKNVTCYVMEDCSHFTGVKAASPDALSWGFWSVNTNLGFQLKRRDDNCAALTLIGISDTPCRNELNLHLRIYM